MKAIILCAGYATRLYPLTENQPKGLLPLNGKPIIEYLAEKIEKIDVVDEIILISNHKFYQNFLDWANAYTPTRSIKLTVLDDGTTSNEDRLGAIGDIQFTIDALDIDDELIIYASDNYFTFELTDFYNFYREKNADCVLASEFEDVEFLAKNFAVGWLDENNKILDIKEKPGGVPNSNVGIWAGYFYTRETVKMFKQYLNEGNSKDSPGNFPVWLHKIKDVFAFVFEGECFDIGTKEVYYALDERLEKENKK